MVFLSYIQALRPKHWTKNLLVFAGVVLAERYDLIPQSIFIFLAFCFASSAIYIINDLHDRKDDQRHPTKKNRPIASGAVSVPMAVFMVAFLIISAACISMQLSLPSSSLLVLYVIINIFYTFLLKDVVVVDVFVIALGFMIRAFAGTVGLGIRDSPWFIITIIALSLLLVFSKRLSEKFLPAKAQRSSLLHYSEQFLRHSTLLCMSLSIASYAVYVIEKYTSYFSFASVVLVLFGFLRYLYLVDAKKVGADPVEDFFSDPPLMISVVLWAIVFYVGAHV